MARSKTTMRLSSTTIIKSGPDAEMEAVRLRYGCVAAIELGRRQQYCRRLLLGVLLLLSWTGMEGNEGAVRKDHLNRYLGLDTRRTEEGSFQATLWDDIVRLSLE